MINLFICQSYLILKLLAFLFGLFRALDHLIQWQSNNYRIKKDLINKLYSLLNSQLIIKRFKSKLCLNFHKLSVDPCLRPIVFIPQVDKSFSQVRMVGPKFILQVYLLCVVYEWFGKDSNDQRQNFEERQNHSCKDSYQKNMINQENSLYQQQQKYNLMKRTKQTYFRNFPSEQQTNLMSGCRQFEGEDLKYDARRQFFKNKQKQWLDEQMQEKRQRKEQQKFQNQLYDQQTQQLNRMRGMLEDNFQKTKSNIQGSTTKTNQQLDLERKEKQKADKQARLKYEKQEAEYLKQRGAKQDFYMDVK